MNERELALEAVGVQNACNCGAVCRTFTRRVLENQDVLNHSEHPIIQAWLNKIADMLGICDVTIAKTETPVAMAEFCELAERLQERLQPLGYTQVRTDAKVLAIIIEMIGLAGGSSAVNSLKPHDMVLTLSESESEAGK